MTETLTPPRSLAHSRTEDLVAILTGVALVSVMPRA